MNKKWVQSRPSLTSMLRRIQHNVYVVTVSGLWWQNLTITSYRYLQ